MPGMSGFDVCRQIKASAGDDLLPVLLVTALSDRTDRQTGLEAGADDFLSKPVDRHELTLRVRHYLRLRRQHQLLARQYEALQELAALKDDLVTLMVHDLRNPLTGICGLMQVLELDTDDPVRKADVQNAREGARQDARDAGRSAAGAPAGGRPAGPAPVQRPAGRGGPLGRACRWTARPSCAACRSTGGSRRI